jgi:hypothetical protein
MDRRITAAMRVAVSLHKKRRSQHTPNYLHYTFVFTNNALVAYGINRPGPRPLCYADHVLSLHSEWVALWRARSVWKKKLTVINIRLSKNGSLRISRPCDDCQRFLSKFDCSVFYSTDGGFVHESFA